MREGEADIRRDCCPCLDGDDDDGVAVVAVVIGDGLLFFLLLDGRVLLLLLLGVLVVREVLTAGRMLEEGELEVEVDRVFLSDMMKNKMFMRICVLCVCVLLCVLSVLIVSAIILMSKKQSYEWRTGGGNNKTKGVYERERDEKWLRKKKGRKKGNGIPHA